VPWSQVVAVTFNEAMDPASISSSSLTVRDGAGVPVAGVVSYDAPSFTARFTPSAPLVPEMTYTVAIAGGDSQPRVTDVAGNALTADVTSTFTTVAATVPGSAAVSLFDASMTPAVLDGGAEPGVEVGVRFTAGEAGFIRSVRFYKTTTNTGPHVVSLWTATGTLLAQASSVSESASGWQEVNFAAPVAITAGTLYVASYHADAGHYSYTSGFFNAPYAAGLLNAPAGANGVYAYSPWSVFPSSSYNSTNYWVDVIFTTQ
jgi:hypothetical protein